MKNLIVVFMLAGLLQGCGGILYPGDLGNQKLRDDNYISKIKPYETNKYQVQALLGKPKRTTMSSNGDTVWTYEYMTYWMTTYTEHIAKVTFDDKGIVKEYRSGCGKLERSLRWRQIIKKDFTFEKETAILSKI